MTNEIAAPLIALLGVFISVTVAYFTSIRQSKIEAEKLQKGILQDFSLKLFEKRLEVYPELYRLLSEFIKVIQADQISKNNLQDFLGLLHNWDNKHSILFSAKTGSISYQFRVFIAELATKSNEEIKDLYSSPESRRELRHRFQEFELALKSELGIYAFEGPTTVRSFARFDSYGEIAQRSNQ